MGNMIRVKPPAQFGGERSEPGSASPAHGEHTVEILQRLGRDEAEIGRLLANGPAAGTEA